ncbi:MAG: enoyl-CoA hydratase/isomerase family protein, partial [Hyphomicrobiales bacterium]|nr:enoyl-CoA hydratase/isomerase family protein [Hyphomicrobiales bacterium]
MNPPTDPVRTERHDDVAVVIVKNPPVNALSQAVRAGLAEAFKALRDDGGVTAIVLACAGRTFVAGADIREFGKPLQPPLLTEVIDAIEASPKPVVAAIHGTALGGGFELALGCHYRVMRADAQIGLPEVTLGIIPGAGGTQRLPRLTGFSAAVDLVTSGRRVTAAEAERLGIADRVVDGDVKEAAIAFAREKAAAGGRHPVTSARPLPPFDQTEFVKDAARVANKARGQLSPVRAVESIRNAAEMSFSEGMQREREIFTELVGSDQSAALRYAFFGEREVGKVPGLDGVEPRDIESAVVLGAGTMGSGIAIAFADAGIAVTVVETDDAALERGRERITATYDGQVERGRIDAAKREARLSRLGFTTDLEACTGADLYIEAVFEDMAVKRQVFARLDAIAPEGALLATNTSYLDVDEIAAATGRPASVLGLHFFSPANVMKLL